MHAPNKRGRAAILCCLATCLAQSRSGFAEPASARSSGEERITELPGKTEFNQCKKLRAGKRIVKLNLKPDSEISDLIAWISSISCKGILIAGPPIAGKKVTILSPQAITPEEAYSLFLGALDSVGLTVEPMGDFLRVIETSRARFSPMPFYKEGEKP
jgi:general secretion pathway protein D